MDEPTRKAPTPTEHSPRKVDPHADWHRLTGGTGLPPGLGGSLEAPMTTSMSKPIHGTVEDIVLMIAAACHQQNRAWCIAHGDNSQPLWSEAPEWQRKSAILGVRGALDGNTPEQSHEGWLEEKRKDGWTYGPVKDVEKKQHPCFVPYAELPEEQKAKDHFFIDMVRELGRIFGLTEKQTT
jgi:hypothetical protein